jgi:general secretion pathway protein D
MKQKHLRAVLALVLAVFLGAMTLSAKAKKGEQYFKLGVAAEAKKDWDTAVTNYQKAVDEDATNPAYEIAMRRARFQAGQKHVDEGVKLRTQDKLAEAMQEFQKALLTDPASQVAIQEMKRTQQMMLDKDRGAVLSGETGLTATERLRKEEDERVASIEAPPELKPSVRKLPPSKMANTTPTTMYRTVAAMAGLYVSFDPAGLQSNKPLDVNLEEMTVEQALDYLAFVTHTFWKPISSNTIFVCDDSTQKRRDFQSEVVRVFYMPNAGTVQEFQEIANALRTVAEIRRVFTYNAGRAMIVRGTPDEVALVEKLVHDLDKPKAEVIVDVMIMETNSSYSKQLAATIASGGTAGLNVPFAFTPTTNIAVNSTGSTSTTTSTTATTTTVPTTVPTTTTPTSTGSSSVALNSLAHLSTSDFSTSLPGALLEAMLTDTRTKVLNRPQVRASDGMKVELQVGLRIPYATGSLGSAVGATTVGVSPLVQTQFSYADTGVTLIIQPTVHSADELTMHVEITVASVEEYEQLGGGISQPVISQEKNITDVRMRNGEVSLLGGLNQSTDSNTLNGIPGLTNIPVLGKFLFGSTSQQKMSDQILIAVTPHIIRTPDYSPENLRTIYAGSDQNIRVIHQQLPDATPVILPAKPDGAKPDAAKPEAAAAPAAPAAPSARLSFREGSVQVARNATFTLTVQLDGGADVYSVAPLQIKFDPALVRLNGAAAGDLLTRDGVRVTKEQDIRNDAGEATVSLSRLPGAKGVTGSGAVATLDFSAVGKGKGTISITGASVKNSQLEPEPAALATLSVTVQ